VAATGIIAASAKRHGESINGGSVAASKAAANQAA